MTNDTKDQIADSVTELQKSAARKAFLEGWKQARHQKELDRISRKTALSEFEEWWVQNE